MMDDNVKLMQVTFLELPDDTDSGLTIDPNNDLYTVLADEKLLKVQYMPTHGEDVKIDPKCCYAYKGYLYAFRGFIYKSEEANVPGIYYNKNTSKYEIVLCDPENPDHDKYAIKNNQINSIPTAEKIQEDLNDRGEKIYVALKTNNAKNNVPPINAKDNALKRALKKVLKAKGIRLDEYRANFASKNEVFNLNQVLKSESGKLSIMLWDRAVEALHLKYVIVVTDADDKYVCGAPITEPIVVSYDDTYDMYSAPEEVTVGQPDDDEDNDEDDDNEE